MIGKCQDLIQYLFEQDRDKLFEIKEHKEKRSLSQNAYAWKLINEIGNKIGKSKEELYVEMLKDYGQHEVISMLSTIDPKGYFKYYEVIGTGIVNDKEFTHYKIFKGSSEFNTLEMKVFIDGIIQEATQLGIPTITEKELESMRLI
jgi:hypothetical protein